MKVHRILLVMLVLVAALPSCKQNETPAPPVASKTAAADTVTPLTVHYNRIFREVFGCEGCGLEVIIGYQDAASPLESRAVRTAASLKGKPGEGGIAATFNVAYPEKFAEGTRLIYQFRLTYMDIWSKKLEKADFITFDRDHPKKLTLAAFIFGFGKFPVITDFDGMENRGMLLPVQLTGGTDAQPMMAMGLTNIRKEDVANNLYVPLPVDPNFEGYVMVKTDHPCFYGSTVSFENARGKRIGGMQAFNTVPTFTELGESLAWGHSMWILVKAPDNLQERTVVLRQWNGKVSRWHHGLGAEENFEIALSEGSDDCSPIWRSGERIIRSH